MALLAPQTTPTPNTLHLYWQEGSGRSCLLLDDHPYKKQKFVLSASETQANRLRPTGWQHNMPESKKSAPRC